MYQRRARHNEQIAESHLNKFKSRSAASYFAQCSSLIRIYVIPEAAILLFSSLFFRRGISREWAIANDASSEIINSESSYRTRRAILPFRDNENIRYDSLAIYRISRRIIYHSAIPRPALISGNRTDDRRRAQHSRVSLNIFRQTFEDSVERFARWLCRCARFVRGELLQFFAYGRDRRTAYLCGP